MFISAPGSAKTHGATWEVGQDTHLVQQWQKNRHRVSSSTWVFSRNENKSVFFLFFYAAAVYLRPTDMSVSSSPALTSLFRRLPQREVIFSFLLSNNEDKGSRTKRGGGHKDGDVIPGSGKQSRRRTRKKAALRYLKVQLPARETHHGQFG